jgi:LAS superfamily LD-carboxypeptidase LdcB
MDALGIAGIHQRIAQVEARFVMPASVAPVRAVAGATAVGEKNFAGVLDAAMTQGPQAAGNAGAASPEELGFENGRIPKHAMQSIGVGNHRLWGPAADGFTRMRADARAAGVDIGVTDSYRSYDAQVDVARRKGLYSQGGLAATPGTSDHGWGMSLDLDLDSRALSWMRANAGRYGFVEDVPREPWHWTFGGER